eukprot:4278686-Pleurochrysis_carterae.AAC.5
MSAVHAKTQELRGERKKEARKRGQKRKGERENWEEGRRERKEGGVRTDRLIDRPTGNGGGGGVSSRQPLTAYKPEPNSGSAGATRASARTAGMSTTAASTSSDKSFPSLLYSLCFPWICLPNFEKLRVMGDLRIFRSVSVCCPISKAVLTQERPTDNLYMSICTWNVR